MDDRQISAVTASHPTLSLPKPQAPHELGESGVETPYDGGIGGKIERGFGPPKANSFKYPSANPLSASGERELESEVMPRKRVTLMFVRPSFDSSRVEPHFHNRSEKDFSSEPDAPRLRTDSTFSQPRRTLTTE